MLLKLGDKHKVKALLQEGIEQAQQAPALHHDIEARLTHFLDFVRSWAPDKIVMRVIY